MAAQRVDGVLLDGSEASIDLVDALLGAFRDDGTRPEQIAETLISFGAYVGELIVREHGARWVKGGERGGVGRSWPVLSLAPDRIVDPIGEVFAWVGEGSPGVARQRYLAMLGY